VTRIPPRPTSCVPCSAHNSTRTSSIPSDSVRSHTPHGSRIRHSHAHTVFIPSPTRDLARVYGSAFHEHGGGARFRVPRRLSARLVMRLSTIRPLLAILHATRMCTVTWCPVSTAIRVPSNSTPFVSKAAQTSTQVVRLPDALRSGAQSRACGRWPTTGKRCGETYFISLSASTDRKICRCRSARKARNIP
jgi:hypothetical protein